MSGSNLMLSSIFSQFNAIQRSLISAFVGLFGYGAWAFTVNYSHGSVAAAKASIVQGGYSFILTWIMTLLVEGLFQALSRIIKNDPVIRLITATTVCGVIFSTSWWLNIMAGTPEVFKTVVLGYIIGGLYTFSYAFGLSSQHSASASK